MLRTSTRLFLLIAALVLASCQEPKPPDAPLQTDVSIEQVYQEAREAYRLQQYDEAAQKFARVAQSDPKHFNALVNWGVALSRGGKPLEAIPKFQQALALDPSNLNRAEVYCNWGAALQRLRKHREAVEKLQQAIALKPALLTPTMQHYLQRHGSLLPDTPPLAPR